MVELTFINLLLVTLIALIASLDLGMKSATFRFNFKTGFIAALLLFAVFLNHTFVLRNFDIEHSNGFTNIQFKHGSITIHCNTGRLGSYQYTVTKGTRLIDSEDVNEIIDTGCLSTPHSTTVLNEDYHKSEPAIPYQLHDTFWKFNSHNRFNYELVATSGRVHPKDQILNLVECLRQRDRVSVIGGPIWNNIHSDEYSLLPISHWMVILYDDDYLAWHWPSEKLSKFNLKTDYLVEPENLKTFLGYEDESLARKEPALELIDLCGVDSQS